MLYRGIFCIGEKTVLIKFTEVLDRFTVVLILNLAFNLIIKLVSVHLVENKNAHYLQY